MSLLQEQQQQQQQQQQPQPVYGYPTALTNQQQQPIQQHHSTNDGSFGSVFIVLAVIVVISAIACFLGRICSKRMSGHSKTKHSHESGFDHKKHKKNNKEKNNKEKDIEFGFEMSRPVRVKDKDIEFGFDKKVQSGKIHAAGGNNQQQGVRGFQNFKNGEFGFKGGDGKHNMPPNYGGEF